MLFYKVVGNAKPSCSSDVAPTDIKVILSDVERPLKQSAVVDTRGEFQFHNVLPGNYSILAESLNLDLDKSLSTRKIEVFGPNQHISDSIEVRIPVNDYC